MLEKLITVLFSLGLVGMYLAIAFVAAVLIQFIVYQLTGISIYNKLVKVLITDQLKK